MIQCSRSKIKLALHCYCCCLSGKDVEQSHRGLFTVLPQHLYGANKENQKEEYLQLAHWASVLRFETQTFQIRNTKAINSTMTLN